MSNCNLLRAQGETGPSAPEPKERKDLLGEGGSEGVDGLLGDGIDKGHPAHFIVKRYLHLPRLLLQGQSRGEGAECRHKAPGQPHSPHALLRPQPQLPLALHILAYHAHGAAATMGQVHAHHPRVSPPREATMGQDTGGSVKTLRGVWRVLPFVGEPSPLVVLRQEELGVGSLGI